MKVYNKTVPAAYSIGYSALTCLSLYRDSLYGNHVTKNGICWPEQLDNELYWPAFKPCEVIFVLHVLSPTAACHLHNLVKVFLWRNKAGLSLNFSLDALTAVSSLCHEIFALRFLGEAGKSIILWAASTFTAGTDSKSYQPNWCRLL